MIREREASLQRAEAMRDFPGKDRYIHELEMSIERIVRTWNCQKLNGKTG